ncbi:MAG: hypothetical protein JXA03_08325 [Bacteroidales bacterium]|nr:hypothetical protein [Bacteroidales bacterium]
MKILFDFLVRFVPPLTALSALSALSADRQATGRRQAGDRQVCGLRDLLLYFKSIA